jgi:hypothetical protein
MTPLDAANRTASDASQLGPHTITLTGRTMADIGISRSPRAQHSLLEPSGQGRVSFAQTLQTDDGVLLVLRTPGRWIFDVF